MLKSVAFDWPWREVQGFHELKEEGGVVDCRMLVLLGSSRGSVLVHGQSMGGGIGLWGEWRWGDWGHCEQRSVT